MSHYIAHRRPGQAWAFDGPYAVRSNAESRRERFARDGFEARLCDEHEKTALQAGQKPVPFDLPEAVLENLRRAEEAEIHTKPPVLPRSPGRPRKVKKR